MKKNVSKVGHVIEKKSAQKDIKTELLMRFAHTLGCEGIKEVREYVSIIRDLDAFLDGSSSLLTCSTAELAAYRQSMLERIPAYARATVANRLFRIRKFFSFLEDQKLRMYNPADGLATIRIPRTLPRSVLTIDQMGRLLNEFALRDVTDVMVKTIIELLYGSALRISEVCILKEKHVDPVRAELTVFETKTSITRLVPASRASMLQLESYRKTTRKACVSTAQLAEGFLFPQHGSAAVRCLVNRRLKDECTRLGLPVITSHSFRHSAASHMLAHGAGIRQVQSFLGHQAISSTERYTRVITEDLENVINSCHPREVGIL